MLSGFPAFGTLTANEGRDRIHWHSLKGFLQDEQGCLDSLCNEFLNSKYSGLKVFTCRRFPARLPLNYPYQQPFYI